MQLSKHHLKRSSSKSAARKMTAIECGVRSTHSQATSDMSKQNATWSEEQYYFTDDDEDGQGADPDPRSDDKHKGHYWDYPDKE